MDPKLDWASWFAVALPVSIISILLIWLLLLVMYRPARSPDGEGEIEIRTIRPTRESFTLKQYWVTFVCLFTITLWCFEHKIEGLVGDMGVIAIIPIVAFFATGVLKKVCAEYIGDIDTNPHVLKDDFEQFAWTIVFLAMGGIALGKGVTSSGLMVTMDRMIHRLLEGLSLYTVVLVLSPVVLVCGHLLWCSQFAQTSFRSYRHLSVIRLQACYWFPSRKRLEKAYPATMQICSFL